MHRFQKLESPHLNLETLCLSIIAAPPSVSGFGLSGDTIFSLPYT